MDARLRLFLTYLHQWYFSNKLCVLCVFSGFRGPCGGEIFPGGGGSGGAEYTGWCRWSRKVSEQTARHIQRHPDRLQRGCLFCTLPLQHSFTLAQKRTFWQDCCVIFTLFAQKQPQQMIVLLCAALPCPPLVETRRGSMWVSQANTNSHNLWICAHERCSNVHYTFSWRESAGKPRLVWQPELKCGRRIEGQKRFGPVWRRRGTARSKGAWLWLQRAASGQKTEICL